jgi:hypothetical protein
MPTHRTLSRALIATALSTALLLSGGAAQAREQWTTEVANAWYAKQPWMAGANYLPRTAINELEMWQAESFDPKTIDEEFGWAEGLGFTTMRVFLHNLPWEQDKAGFIARIEQVLGLADKHHLRLMLVIFDSCWDPLPHLGKQREPLPHTHNSGWVQAPGAAIVGDPAVWDARLKDYVTGVIGHFRDDRRILLWDLFNELDNKFGPPPFDKDDLPDKKELSLKLAERTRAWALSADPSQPVTFCVWMDLARELEKQEPWQKFQLTASDVITFHSYDPLDALKPGIARLRSYGRPLLCTEYMARPRGSTFAAIMPYFKDEKIAAVNWGFVDGKSQTKYPWDSWKEKYTAEPALWFHDILHADGTAYDGKEVALIKGLTGGKP